MIKKMYFRRTHFRIFVLAVSFALAGCSSRLNRFDVIFHSTKITVTKHEVADQGSGNVSSVVGPGGHTVRRVTLGGSYLRRMNVVGPNTGLRAGVHGEPEN